MSGPGEKNPGREKEITTPTHSPLPRSILAERLSTNTPDALDQPERPMPDFNLAAMSLAELRYLQKSVAKAISTFEARQKAEAREKVEMLAKGLGFTLAELAELEEPKRNRAPSTKVYRHPENPALGRLEVMVAELSFGEIEKRGRNGQVAISGRICQNSDLTRPKTSQKPVGPFDLPTMHAVNLYRVVTCEIG
jgi:DNA-binding protein H-NS